MALNAKTVAARISERLTQLYSDCLAGHVALSDSIRLWTLVGEEAKPVLHELLTHLYGHAYRRIRRQSQAFKFTLQLGHTRPRVNLSQNALKEHLPSVLCELTVSYLEVTDAVHELERRKQRFHQKQRRLTRMFDRSPPKRKFHTHYLPQRPNRYHSHHFDREWTRSRIQHYCFHADVGVSLK